jgi:hypothetical protein
VEQEDGEEQREKINPQKMAYEKLRVYGGA